MYIMFKVFLLNKDFLYLSTPPYVGEIFLSSRGNQDVEKAPVSGHQRWGDFWIKRASFCGS